MIWVALGVGAAGGVAVAIIEFVVSKAKYLKPSAGRTMEISTSRGWHVFVTKPVWWIDQVGTLIGLAALALGLVYVLILRRMKPL